MLLGYSGSQERVVKTKERGETGWGGKEGGSRSPLLLFGKILCSGDEVAFFWISTEIYEEEQKCEKIPVMIYGILYLEQPLEVGCA